MTQATRSWIFASLLFYGWPIMTAVSVAGQPAQFTCIEPAEVTILRAAEAFPGGAYLAENIVRPVDPRGRRADYASRGLGAQTFIDFDLGRSIPVCAFRHVQRKTPDIVQAADLIFSDQPDFRQTLQAVKVQHVGEQGGTTYTAFPPVTARYVRWQVTEVDPNRSQNVGGQHIQFFTPTGAVDAQPSGIGIDAKTLPIIKQQGDTLVLPVQVVLDYPYAEPIDVEVSIGDASPQTCQLQYGKQQVELAYASRDSIAHRVKVSIRREGESMVAKDVMIDPTQRLDVYLLPHSHTDIGYTAIQTDIEEKQVNNLIHGLAEVERTADYPDGARFVWNVEVTWAADLFLQRMPESSRTAFFDAVKRGQVALNGMYLNELTGLCRPEELLLLFRHAAQLTQITGVPIESAMISDVPGYTWGTVPAMNAAGIKYFSVAPNYFDRIGDILVQWENKPFWWVGPDGKSRVLVWIPLRGYALSHLYGHLTPEFVGEFCRDLQQQEYPYDIAYLRWAGHGDNAAPEPSICDFAKKWNAEHVSPRFIISSTDTAFRAFDQRYGDQLPELRGDWSPYWEDGAGSSSYETALNRATSERMSQAQTLWAMLAPSHFPAARFDEAWKNTLLYSEHTWGAHCSISSPTIPFTLEQWDIKRSYALTANLQSRQLLSDAVHHRDAHAIATSSDVVLDRSEAVAYVDVYNTSSWERTEVVCLPRELTRPGDKVTDLDGNPVTSQRLASDELAVYIEALPPYAGRRLKITGGKPTSTQHGITAGGVSLSNDLLALRLDKQTGGVVDLRLKQLDHNYVDGADGHAVNDYLYLIGSDVSQVVKNEPVKISVRDGGPLVGTMRVESEAQGCERLTRDVRVVAGGDYVELLNHVDKQRLVADNYYAESGKESVNFAFPFAVPEGEMRLDVPFGVIRPEVDQIPSACKNWLTVGRWATVSNEDLGVTWVTLDAPLVQVGGITANLLNSQSDPNVWRKKIEPTQKLYSWAMNNHWGTNYRAFQEDPVLFRYVVRLQQGRADDAAATRFATSRSQPLVAVPSRGPAPQGESMLRIGDDEVTVVGLKPSDDGNGVIVRLLNVSDRDIQSTLMWNDGMVSSMALSDTSELPRAPLDGPVAIPARGLVTVRAELSP